MPKTEKLQTPKARIPRGFRDCLGPQVAAEREMLARICKAYEAWGFDALETPALEYTDALGKFLPDIDRPNDGVFSLKDDDDQWLSLRYDLTAPLARYVAENYESLSKPFRRYAVGAVWRNEKPGPGRFRQFTQCDADTVGAPAPYADAECCAMLSEAIEAAGIPANEFVIRINDRNALAGLLETIELSGEELAGQRLKIFRAMDKLDRLGEAGVRLLLGPGRKDESGDFTEGAKLKDPDIERVVAFMKATGDTNGATCARLADVVGGSKAGAKGVETLAAIARELSRSGFDERRIRIDLSVIRGLEYYTGPVFEAELRAAFMADDGKLVRFGSIASGGRYDDLVSRFKGTEIPAVGVSIGVSRLLAALTRMNRGEDAAAGPIVVIAFDREHMADYQQMAAELRAAGFRAEVYVGGAGMKAQMKYADRRRAPLAIIQGGDERARGEVIVKDLILGAEISSQIAGHDEWKDMRAAQIAVPRERLAEEVLRVMARLHAPKAESTS